MDFVDRCSIYFHRDGHGLYSTFLPVRFVSRNWQMLVVGFDADSQVPAKAQRTMQPHPMRISSRSPGKRKIETFAHPSAARSEQHSTAWRVKKTLHAWLTVFQIYKHKKIYMYLSIVARVGVAVAADFPPTFSAADMRCYHVQIQL